MEADVAYVTAGANGTNCTKDEPCGTLQDGLEQNRTYVKVAKGSVKGSTTIDHQIVTILADKGAILTIDNSQTGKPVLEIGDQVSVQIYDLEITGATGANGDGIQSEKNSTLSLIHVAIHDNDGIGIRIMNGILTVDQSSIFSNKAGGIRMFTANGGGTLFMIINNFIYHNGSTMSTVGGLSLLPVGASKLEFNTVADNTSSGSTSAGGVICNQNGFVAPHNIFFRNMTGTSGNVQTFGECDMGDSLMSDTNSSLDFLRPDDTPYDYHLTSAAPTSITAAVTDAEACTGVDFDGDSRSVGGPCALGADQPKP